MTTYKILRWDVLLDPEGNRRPAIYIVPDVSLMELFTDRNYSVMVKISGTNMVYDQIGPTFASFVPSSCAGGYRPNFFQETKTFVGTLSNVVWNGYPNEDSLGQIEFMNLSSTGNEQEDDKNQNTNQTEPLMSLDGNKTGLSNDMLTLIFTVICLFILMSVIFVIISRDSKK